MSLLTNARLRAFQNAGPPTSGTSGTYAGEQGVAGGYLWDTTNYVLFVNEGSQASPYWTPCPYDQAPLFGVNTDWRDGAGAALAGTTMSVLVPGSGVRIFGDGHADTDSGAVAQTAGEGGTVMRLTTTNEASHVIALGMAAGVMQPDQHGTMVIDVEASNVSAITLRSMFVGFVGTAIDAFVAAVTGATTTATLVQDDLAGMFFDVGLTAGDRLYGVHNKSNAAATQDLTADGDTSTDIAAAGTFQRLRVEIAADGDMTCFVDKAQVYTQAIALDVDEECSPIFYLQSTSAATKSIDVRRFACWAYR
jgi:hypothetical protein